MADQERRGPGRPRGTGIVDPDDILDATLNAIASGGYDKLSMRAIAKSLGVSLSTVQHHFNTKAELWQAAVDHFFSEGDQRRLGLDEEDLTARIRNALDLSTAYPGVIHALLSDRSDGHEQRLGFVTSRFKAMVAYGVEVIEQRQADDIAGQFEPHALLLLITIGVGAIANAPDAVEELFGYELPDPTGLDRLSRDLADIIGDGIYPTPHITEDPSR